MTTQNFREKSTVLFVLACVVVLAPIFVFAQMCPNDEPKVNCTNPNGGITVECGNCPAWEENVTPGSGTAPTPTINKRSTGDKYGCDSVHLNHNGQSITCWKVGIQGGQKVYDKCRYPEGATTCDQLLNQAKEALESGQPNIQETYSALNDSLKDIQDYDPTYTPEMIERDAEAAYQSLTGKPYLSLIHI